MRPAIHSDAKNVPLIVKAVRAEHSRKFVSDHEFKIIE